jgi:hypothetical protein
MSKNNHETVSRKELGRPDAPAEKTPDLPAPILLTELDVANLAYQRWVKRGCPEGSPQEDWYEAEHELQSLSRAS